MAVRTLPGLGLAAYWDLGSDGWKDGMDANLRLVSALCQARVESMTTVLPASPADGVMYLVPASDSTNGKKIAIRDAGAWVYFNPSEGFLCYVKDSDRFVWYNGTDWVPLVSGGSGGEGGGGVGVKSDQWRILFKTNGGDSRTGVGEIEMKAFPTGPDLTVDGTASSSSNYSGTASNAFDGNNATIWMAEGTNGQWVAYAFPEAVTVEYLLIRSITDPSYAVVCGPKSFDVQYLDGTTWRTYWSWSGMTFTGPANQQAAYREDFQVGIPKAGSIGMALVKKSNADYDVEWVVVEGAGGDSGHEYWRFVPSTTSGDNYVHGVEFKMMAEPGGDQLAVNGSFLESGHYGSDSAANLFDNNNATRWESQNANVAAGSVWAGYHFPTKVDIRAIAWTLDLGYENDERPLLGKMQYSDDGVNWTDAFPTSFTWTGSSGYQTQLSAHPDYAKARTVTAATDLAISDAGRTVIVNSAAAVNVGIPVNLPMLVGDTISILQKGVGVPTLVPVSGVTLNVPATFAAKTKFQHGIISIMCTGLNEYVAMGALASA